MYDQCDGEEQSPINISTDDAVYDSNLPKIKFIHYEQFYYWNVTRNNNSVFIMPTVLLNRSVPKLYGSGRNKSESAALVQIHFHWGVYSFSF